MKFTIRDLFLVTMIVALAVGWGIDHRRQAAAIGIEKEQSAAMYDLLRKIGMRWVPDSTAPAPNPPKP